jgi:chitinase
MLFKTLARLAVAGAALLNVHAAPLASPAVHARDAPATPRFVVYQDLAASTPNGFPAPADLYGYNVLCAPPRAARAVRVSLTRSGRNLAFHLSTGPADMATAWQNLDRGARRDLHDLYAGHGIKIMVAVFGGTDTPTTNVSTAH